VGIEKHKLKSNHTWKSNPGYSICVIDRGLVRFDYPSNWIVEPEEGAVHLHDRPPSVESCDLGVSIFRVPAGQARELSLDDTLRATLGNDRKPYQQSEIHHIARGDLEIAWLEQRYFDAEYKRDARFRVALARGPVLCLISMNYWSNRAAGLEGVWSEVLRTLVIGMRIEDPTAGPVIQ
jgi:hypothetical protein